MTETKPSFGSNGGSTMVLSLEDFQGELPDNLQKVVDENTGYSGFLVQIADGHVSLMWFDEDDEMVGLEGEYD